MGLQCPHLGPEGGDPSWHLPGVGGPQWKHQLPVLLGFWPPEPQAGLLVVTLKRGTGHLGAQ